MQLRFLKKYHMGTNIANKFDTYKLRSTKVLQFFDDATQTWKDVVLVDDPVTKQSTLDEIQAKEANNG